MLIVFVQDNLTLNDRPTASNGSMRPPPSRSNTGEKPPPPYSSTRTRGENVPPRGPPGHRPSRSQEEALRARKQGPSSRSSRPTGDLDVFADPRPSDGKSGSRRGRRNSDSSVMSKKLLDPEEEKRRAERRRRERREKERGGKESSSKSKKPRNLDIIDKLDVTSIYGTGLFHHDGPFDACNPNRNRQGSRRAPMSAFPKDSLNNSMGGSGPLNKRPDHATFLGNNDEEAFKDYSGQNGFQNGARPAPQRVDSNVVSATTRIEPIHGEETPGLGTSTFLEGAPASRTAMQRRESETGPMETGGLGRKKSLAQRIKGINGGPRRDYGPAGRVTSPDGMTSSRSPDNAAFTPGGSKLHESNPFFHEYNKGDDSKTQGVTFVKPEKTGRPRAPSSPRRGFAGLERRATSDSTGDRELPKAGGGFLSRVKSLKGGPRKRPAPPPPQEA
ncbi:Pal1 cell morphology protein-domain-containing protein [Amylocarpus encephaloides]|uniref:Pal1 cell morphology protein-domain-containing protein n=1 Tax=Amylocarpus encephaloides TaxID=45428 RepID=A0A9P7YHN3_9HELO|nr:Pal1 cell morphology protein-domain-containing protein [Amylocarpus encephaloides]